jgi:hypothetical protein
MRKAKKSKRARCAYKRCNKDIKKNISYYYKGKYYCNKNHAIKDKKGVE